MSPATASSKAFGLGNQMMNIKPYYAVILAAMFLTSCRDIAFDLERYKQAVKSGFPKIPQAKQIEQLLGESDHFISYHGSRSLGQEWNTEVFFADRYELAMQVEVKVDYWFSEVLEVVGEPKFYLAEITSVDYDNGGVGANMLGIHSEFGPKEWAKVYQAKGDFSVIGIQLKKNAPVPRFEEYVRATRRDCVQVRPE